MIHEKRSAILERAVDILPLIAELVLVYVEILHLVEYLQRILVHDVDLETLSVFRDVRQGDAGVDDEAVKVVLTAVRIERETEEILGRLHLSVAVQVLIQPVYP